MKRKNFFVKQLVFVLALIYLFSMAACKKDDAQTETTNATTTTSGTTAAATTTETTEPEKEVITLTIWAGAETAMPKDNPIINEIEKITKVRMELVDTSGDKATVMFAAGETLDINNLEAGPYVAEVISRNMALILDDYLPDYGKNLLNYHTKALNLYKDFQSNGKYVFMPSYAGDPAQPPVPLRTPGPTNLYVRWDYFKEIGAPKLNTLDDLIDALSMMTKNHPETKNGAKVYGVSGWMEWGPWNFMTQFCFPQFGAVNLSTFGLMTGDNEFVYDLAESDGAFWTAVDFYFKSNQAGILDPDFFINKYGDYVAKYKAGQLLTLAANWMLGDASSSISADAPMATFVALPIMEKWKYNIAISQVSYTNSGSGVFLKYIGSKTKYPERAVEFMDWMSTPEAARLIYSGVQGIHWDYIDGVPAVLPEVKEAMKADPDYRVKNGLSLGYGQWAAFGNSILLPDGKAAGLSVGDTSVYKIQNTPGDQDFCDFYGIDYPGQIFQKLVEQGKFKNPARIGEIPTAIPAAPPEILQKEADIYTYVVAALPDLVLAEDRSTFLEQRTLVMNELKKLGIDEVKEWYASNFYEAKEKILKSLGLE